MLADDKKMLDGLFHCFISEPDDKLLSFCQKWGNISCDRKMREARLRPVIFEFLREDGPLRQCQVEFAAMLEPTSDLYYMLETFARHAGAADANGFQIFWQEYTEYPYF